MSVVPFLKVIRFWLAYHLPFEQFVAWRFPGFFGDIGLRRFGVSCKYCLRPLRFRTRTVGKETKICKRHTVVTLDKVNIISLRGKLSKSNFKNWMPVAVSEVVHQFEMNICFFLFAAMYTSKVQNHPLLSTGLLQYLGEFIRVAISISFQNSFQFSFLFLF